MLIVNTFPHAPSMLVNVVDALAVEAGEGPATSLKSAALHNEPSVCTTDKWTDLENHIYKAKMLNMYAGIETAVAT